MLTWCVMMPGPRTITKAYEVRPSPDLRKENMLSLFLDEKILLLLMIFMGCYWLFLFGDIKGKRGMISILIPH